jgi:hypothetical protein
MRLYACAWVLFAAIGCNRPHADGENAAPKGGTHTNAITEAIARVTSAPAPDHARWRSLKYFFPGIVEGYRAYAVTEGHDLDLGNGEPVVIVKRAYRKGSLLLELEVLDTASTERLRSTFLRMRELTRDNDRAVFRPYKLQNRRAFAQWTAQTASARASVLVADRYLVHVSMKPVQSPEPCVGFLAKLDLASLDKLAGTPEAAASDALLETAIMSEVVDGGSDAATADQPL